MRNQKGFTLVELLVIVLILGLLTAIGIPAYTGVSEYAEQKIVETNLKMIDDAIELYYQTGNTETLRSISDLVPKYLKDEIKGPKSATYSIKDGKATVSSNGETIGGEVFEDKTIDELPW